MIEISANLRKAAHKYLSLHPLQILTYNYICYFIVLVITCIKYVITCLTYILLLVITSVTVTFITYNYISYNILYVITYVTSSYK